MLIAVLVGALVAATVKPAPPPPPPTPREVFERSRTAFARAEYARAIDLLHPLLYPETLLDTEGEVVQAHRMLGVAYLFENKPDDARREFRRLLVLREDYRFDPLLDPQRVVDFFNSVVKEQEAARATIDGRRPKPPKPPSLPPARPMVFVYERRSLAISFIPFGAGQFQNGEVRKGWMFLGVESALAAISVGAFVTNFALYGVEPRRKCTDPALSTGAASGSCPDQFVDRSQEDTSRTLLRVQLVSGGLFFAVAAWGIVDAVRHFQRHSLLAGVSNFDLTLTPSGVGAAWRF